ncbi:hypothetical protein [Corynebacterium sp.]|uniref:hypothetical protein n=1 Tax=Corynebacterium sp. TaxID=1720 RepID=UPI003B3A25D4
MTDLDLDRLRWIVEALSDYETLDEFAKENRLDHVDGIALNPALGGIIKKARALHKELEDHALNIARALVEALEGETGAR